MVSTWAQEQKGFYVPYQMPTHAFVRFNTFVANPAAPLVVNYQEHNVGLYYRNQWMGYKNDNFSLMGLLWSQLAGDQLHEPFSIQAQCNGDDQLWSGA